MVFGIGSRVMTLITTLILTRFIAPHDYGAVLTASITVATAGVLTSFAFGQYLIARKAPPDVAFQAAEAHVLVGVLAMTVVYLIRAPLSNFLDTPEMVPFVAWYAVAHLIDRTRYVPERLLLRNLQFRAMARINGIGELVFAGVALGLAWRLGPYAIVVAVIVRALVTAQLFLVTAPRHEWLVYSPLRFDVVRALYRLRPADHDRRGLRSRGDALGQLDRFEAVWTGCDGAIQPGVQPRRNADRADRRPHRRRPDALLCPHRGSAASERGRAGGCADGAHHLPARDRPGCRRADSGQSRSSTSGGMAWRRC